MQVVVFNNFYGKDTLNSVPREYNFPLKGTEDIFVNITQTNYILLCLKQLIHKTPFKKSSPFKLKYRLKQGSCIQAVFMQKASLQNYQVNQPYNSHHRNQDQQLRTDLTPVYMTQP